MSDEDRHWDPSSKVLMISNPCTRTDESDDI
jgi:hypothetical protein